MSALAAAAANRLLADDTWAAGLLAQHAGKSFRLALPPFELALRINAQGGFERIDATPAAFDLELILPPTALLLALTGRSALERAVEARGDTALAEALRDLSDAMPWYLEQALAQWIGPALAQRLATLARGLAAWPAYARTRIGASVATYLTEEQPTLLKRLDAEAFAAAVTRLRDDVARLEQRVERAASARLNPRGDFRAVGASER